MCRVHINIQYILQQGALSRNTLEIILDLPFGFPTNNIISLSDFENIPMNKISPVKALQTGRFVRPYKFASALSQASPTGKVRSGTANSVMSKTGRLHSSQIAKVLAESSLATPTQAQQVAIDSLFCSQNFGNFARFCQRK